MESVVRMMIAAEIRCVCSVDGVMRINAACSATGIGYPLRKAVAVIAYIVNGRCSTIA